MRAACAAAPSHAPPTVHRAPHVALYLTTVDDELVHSKLGTGVFPNYGQIVDDLVAKAASLKEATAAAAASSRTKGGGSGSGADAGATPSVGIAGCTVL